jgi:hypothetical protein
MSETTKTALWRVLPWLLLVGATWIWAGSNGA